MRVPAAWFRSRNDSNAGHSERSLSGLVSSYLQLSDLVMINLLPDVAVSTRCRLPASLFIATLSALCFDFFFIPPYFRWRPRTHSELLREVWGPDSAEEVEYLRTFMRQLRYKLEPEPTQPRYLVTIPRVGYRLKAD